mmetsp:Transcript_4703/g.6690  ORF Transcript_4703/g.6690 Transcript_4703/m.6690 type:complete len:182 (+) Transcript_4703:38-583(+)
MAAVIESVEPVNTVHMDGLAVLKILKHCQESLPNLVTGSLLGLSQGNGILEITHAFPFPEPLDSNNSNNDASDDATTPTNENNPTSSTTNNPTSALMGRSVGLFKHTSLRKLSAVWSVSKDIQYVCVRVGLGNASWTVASMIVEGMRGRVCLVVVVYILLGASVELKFPIFRQKIFEVRFS